MTLTELPSFVRNELGLTGLLLTTDLLAGADRARLMQVLECADKAACPVLAIAEVNPLPLADTDDRKADAAVERCMRVAQAAHWMGCSAFAVPVLAADNDEAMELAAERLKGVARKAEKLDLNLCIAPTVGLTKAPEKVGELLKKIGGFRIGTMPDFAAAADSTDRIAYLRRLVPYASMVVASGVKFESVGATPKAESDEKPKSKSRAKGKKAVEEPEDELRPAAPAPVSVRHTAYDIREMASVLVSVGYEGPIAIDYRGGGDPVPGILHIKSTLERLFDTGLDDDDVLSVLTGELGELDEIEEEDAKDGKEE